MSFIPLPSSDNGTAVRSQIHALNPVSTEVEEVWKDAFTGAIVQIEIPHAAIHLGKYFSHSGIVSIANGATYTHMFITPANPGAHIHLRQFLIDSSSAPLQHYLYEDATVSANGVQQTGKNFNRNHANATLALYHSPTVTSVGDILHTVQIAGSKQLGGAGQTPGTEWVLKQGATYLSQITNTSGGTASVNYIMEWYEL